MRFNDNDNLSLKDWMRFYFRKREEISSLLDLVINLETNISRRDMTKIQTKIWREGSLLAGVDCRPTRRLICIAWQGCFQRRRPFTCYKAGMRCMSLFLDFRPSVGWLIFIFPLAPFIQAEFTLFSSSIPQALLLGFLLSSFLIFFFSFFPLLHFND